MSFEQYLILSRAEWGDLFANKKITHAAYICIFIGYILCFVNDFIDVISLKFTIRFIYGISVAMLLTIMLFGIRFKNLYSIPISIIGFDALYIIINLFNTFTLRNPIQTVTVCYSVMYFIINSLIFRLDAVFLLNFAVMCAVTICAAVSIYAPDIAKGAPSQSFMPNAIVLSVATLLLQHLVLTVRARLTEQLGSVRLQVAALKAEMEIESVKKEAREKTIQLNRISIIEALGASIAHEIKQPIAAALTYCQAARNWSSKECIDAPETMRAVIGIESNVSRASYLIDNIRLLTTKKDREYVVFDIGRIVRDQANLIRSEYERRNIRLALDIPPARLLAQVSVSEVALAVLNLLRNAMEAFDEPYDRPAVSVHCRHSDPDWIEIRVVDNGRGLSPDGILMAFGAFQTTKETGGGIGLSICQEVAEHHSGSISLEPNSSGGVTAILRLAVKQTAR